jgi:UDP-glucose 4-epimerase
MTRVGQLDGRWTHRRVLVTGGTGFLGQHLTRRLVGLGAQTTVALRDDVESRKRVVLPKEVNLQCGDVRNYDQMYRLVEAVAPDIIFHLAAVGTNDPFIAEEKALQVNLHGTLNLLRAVQGSSTGRADRVRRIVVAGTCYEYGDGGRLDPGNVYAASKVGAWAFCRMYYRAHGTPVVVARPFNIYGPGQNERALIPSAIRAALSGRSFPMTRGEQQRDFLYIDDLVEGLIMLALAKGIEGESIDLGTGEATPVRDVVERIFTLVGEAGLTPVVAWPQIGALPYRPGVIWELVANADRTARLTGWRAKTGLDKGLQITIKAMTEL